MMALPISRTAVWLVQLALQSIFRMAELYRFLEIRSSKGEKPGIAFWSLTGKKVCGTATTVWIYPAIASKVAVLRAQLGSSILIAFQSACEATPFRASRRSWIRHGVLPRNRPPLDYATCSHAEGK